MSRKMTRRSFLMLGAGLGATILACGGLGTFALRGPNLTLSEKLAAEDGSKMNKKVLLVYASKCGSTQGVAEAIADELTKRGLAVDVRLTSHVTSLEGYQAVIIGSAVRYGSWLSDAKKFVEQNQAGLQKLPTAFFAVHMMNRGDDEASRKARQAYLDPVRALVKPVDEAYFAGVTDLSKMSLFERTLSKMLKGEQGDFRDWNAIRAWGQTVLA